MSFLPLLWASGKRKKWRIRYIFSQTLHRLWQGFNMKENCLNWPLAYYRSYDFGNIVIYSQRSFCLMCLWTNKTYVFHALRVCPSLTQGTILSPHAAQWSEQGLYLHRDSAGEQLHGVPECQVWGLVCGLHQEREAHQSLQDEAEPERGPFHQEATHGPASLPQHGPKQTLWVHPISVHASSEAEQEITYLFLTRSKRLELIPAVK